MRSKLLQAVGLGTRWRPEQPPTDKGLGGGDAAAVAALELGRAKRARRVPAALQGTIYGEQAEEGSPPRPASTAPGPKRSKGAPTGSGAGRAAARQDSAPGGGSAGGATTASDGAAATTGGATSVTQGPPMVVVVVSDPQVPAWPSFMPLAPAAGSPGSAPFVQTEGGRWQLLPDQLAAQLGQQAAAQLGQQAAAQLGQQAAAHRAVEQQQLAAHRAVEQQQLAEQQARQQQELAERHVCEQQALAAQQGREQQALAERHVCEQQALAGQQAQQALAGQQAQQALAQHPQLTAQQMQQVQLAAQQVQHAQQAAQLAALRPLAVEDLLVPRDQPGGVDAQHAMWSVLQSAGLVPSWATHAQPPPPPAPASQAPPAPSGVWLGGGGSAGPTPHSVATNGPLSRFPSSGTSPAGSLGGPKPSPFAAEAAVPLPNSKEPSAANLEPISKHPLASLLQGDLSLMGLAALAEEGGFGLSSVLTTPSADLHKLFGAWQEGRVSLSLSRRDVPALTAAPFGAPPGQDQLPQKLAPQVLEQLTAQERQP